MLKKKLGKKALAFASAAVMAVSATATGLTALSMTAFAGEELGEGTFENGKGLPWHICENATAVMTVSMRSSWKTSVVLQTAVKAVGTASSVTEI